ncbi:MAG: inactive serine/threonine-protein kinase VRK3, partial [Dehalococcoidia bacterium]
MLCPNCGHQNPEDALFCEQCAADLVPTCPACNRPNNAGARFCRYCRASLESSADLAAVSSNAAPSPSPQTRQEPASFANGRYEVKKFLGEGGKKQVYLAHDSLLDRDVAFALIKTEGLDDVSRTRITREAQAMGRLGSHPHIVTVFDLGEHPSAGSGQASQPYMVTELMGGGDVEGV